MYSLKLTCKLINEHILKKTKRKRKLSARVSKVMQLLLLFNTHNTITFISRYNYHLTISYDADYNDIKFDYESHVQKYLYCIY